MSTRSPWAQPPPSRRGPGVPRPGGTATSNLSARPASSTSRTHVPSLTSHAFFRPMSSQRLQAQRGGTRTPTPNPQQRGSGDFTDSNTHPVPSVASGPTSRPVASVDDSGAPPPSRGTEMSMQEYIRTANTSPTQDLHSHHQNISLSSSNRPLQSQSPTPNPAGLTVNTGLTTYRNGNGNLPTPSKSPHSFRSSFLLPSRGGDLVPHSPNRSNHGHEKLSSGATSPAPRQSDATSAPPTAQQQQGAVTGEKNYQHFPGNTRFWFGGRFQNARDRPVNIATGFLVVLPAVLFFVFPASWLWHEVSPAVPVVFAYIFFICFSSFVHASVSDPGVSSNPPLVCCSFCIL